MNALSPFEPAVSAAPVSDTAVSVAAVSPAHGPAGVWYGKQADMLAMFCTALRRQVGIVVCLCGILAVNGVLTAQEPTGEVDLGQAAPLFDAADEMPPANPPAAKPANPPAVPVPATDVPGGLEDADEAEQQPPAPSAAAAPVKDYLIPTDPVGLFLAGGFLMWPILLSSIISLWFTFERLIVLRRARVIPRAFVDRFLQHVDQGTLNSETALRLCEENRSPIADVFAHGVRKWGKTSVEVEQAIIDGGERQVSFLRTHLRIINGVATIAPLLGLLGTVVGMIMSFNELAQANTADRAERLAGGIGIALITTAAGLFVAIPALIMYMYLSGRVDRMVMEMDSLSQKLVNLISAEALASRAKSGGPPKINQPPAPATASKTKAVGT